MTINSNAYFVYDFDKRIPSQKKIYKIPTKKSEVFRFRFAHSFIGQKLYLSHKAGRWTNLAETYAPNIYCQVNEEVCRYEFRVDFSAMYPYDKTVWMACFVGVRVSSPIGDKANPNIQDSGFFVAFNDKPVARVYHCLKNTWPEGVCTIPLPNSFKETQRLCVTDDGQHITYSMMTEEGKKAILKADLSGDTIVLYDGDGKIAYTGENNLKNHVGGYFKIFNHMAETVISNVSIYSENRQNGQIEKIFSDNFSTYNSSDSYKIVSFSTGPHNIVINDRFYKVEKDDMLLISPYDIYSTFDNYAQKLLLQFNIEYLQQYFSESLIEKALSCFQHPIIRLPGHKQTELKNIIDKLKESNSKSKDNLAFIRLFEILNLLYDGNTESVQEECPNKRITDILRYIDTNYAHIDNIDMIAESFYITKYYLCRTFKHYTGCTVIDYLNHVKVKNACMLLTEDNQLSITEIATYCGFNSVSYFCSTFKKIVGRTPKQFKDQTSTWSIKGKAIQHDKQHIHQEV